MAMVTAADIKNANLEGLESPDEYWAMYTPVLNQALNLGRMGIDLQDQPTVTGYRYGAAPDACSYNYREEVMEYGVSLARLEGGENWFAAAFFADRKEYRYQGVLLPTAGSDGEPLILLVGEMENLDD